MATKNLGQVSGVHIGSTPPDNIILIWYDNTPSQKVHKVYNPSLGQWVVLDQNIISSITYSELVNIAKTVGLSVGQYFQIKDKGNALALAITTTKVQYDDELGNILIDDLGTNIQYHVTSSNLSIDDVVGVFDSVNKKLVFQFNEMSPDFTADDYILGKVKRNNIWSLAKYRLSSLLSKVTGNSITWNGGFFFNFYESLKSQLDKKGGVVSKDSYDRDIELINQNIENVGKANQEIISNANDAIEEATTDTAIYDKKAPALQTGGEPTDAAKGDKLVTILSKFQRYINKFKYATGIRLSTKFTSTGANGKVNNNDTVESAIAKLQNQHDNTKLFIPEDWTPSAEANENIVPGDDYNVAFGKIEADRRQPNSIETEKQDVSLTDTENPSGDYTVKFRIHNGYLEMYFQEKNVMFEWIYTRVIVNDKTRFFKINFSDELSEKLASFLESPEQSAGDVILSDIAVISPYQLGNPSLGSGMGFVAPYQLILARLSFGYHLDVETNKVIFGLILTPVSQMLVELSGSTLRTTISGNNNELIFQNLGTGGFRFYIPKMLIRYKFC